MTGTLRVLVLVIALLGALAAGQYAMNHWTTWDPATKASVFVAGGTILLAVATFWSVWESRLVIRGEDRRMQQRAAPYLTARFRTVPSTEEADASEIVGFHITNSGYGMARDVFIQVEALAARYDSEKLLPERIESAKPYLEGRFILQATYDVIAEKATANAATSYSTYVNRTYRTPDFETTLVVEARLRYLDMFGNRYETVYLDWDRRESQWIAPKQFRL